MLGAWLASGSGCRSANSLESAAGANEATRLDWQALPASGVRAERAPFTLQGDDGNVVRVRSVAVRALVVPPLAFTELELDFDELDGKNMGATFSAELPRGAAVSRFAVHDGADFRDAELVDAAAARAFAAPAPAPSAAEQFSVRVQKQAGHAPRLILDYAERLANAQAPYRVRLSGLAALDSLRVTADIGEPPGHRYQLARAGFTPDRDFSLRAEQLGSKDGAIVWRAGKYLIARIPPPTRPTTDLTFLIDTSASQSLALDRVSERLLELSQALARLQPEVSLTIVGFDQDIHPLLVRARAPLGREQLAPLRALGRLGGTDLVYADSAIRAQGLPSDHLVLLSDLEHGIAPVSRSPRPRDAVPARWDLLASDAASEKKLREQREQWGKLGGQPGLVARFDSDTTALARQLLQPTPTPMHVTVRGATWALPEAGEARSELTPEVGEAVWVFAELSPKAPFALEVAGKPLGGVHEATDPAFVTLLTQMIGQAQLDRLSTGAYPSAGQAPSLSEETARVARQYGLVSPSSSLLVRGGGVGRALAGRAVELTPYAGPRVITTLGTSPPAKPPLAQCPDLIGDTNQHLVDQSCPPLYVNFSSAEPRLIADIQFTGALPNVQVSPHLAELADLLQLRPELTKVSVRASSKARAEGVIRYLVGRGIAAERLQGERLIEGSFPVRRATPKCKTPGEPVVLEALEMSLSPLGPPITKQPALAESSKPSRLASLEQLLRRGAYRGGENELAEARRASERWIAQEPDNPVAYVALGDTLRAQRDVPGAARAYGSLFDLNAPGAGLAVAAAMRLQELAPPHMAPGNREPREANEQRWWDMAIASYRQQWQSQPERFEASRALAYSSLRAEQRADAFGDLLEAAKFSAITQRIELPLFAHFYASQTRDATRLLGLFLPRECTFPSHASVLGAALSWEDVDSELEVNVTSIAGGYGYDSTLREHGAAGGLKWIPLPEADASYPIRVSVRAVRLSKNGFAFGALRTLNSLGKERVWVEEHPFVVTQLAEPVTVLTEQILQRPQ